MTDDPDWWAPLVDRIVGSLDHMDSLDAVVRSVEVAGEETCEVVSAVSFRRPRRWRVVVDGETAEFRSGVSRGHLLSDGQFEFINPDEWAWARRLPWFQLSPDMWITFAPSRLDTPEAVEVAGRASTQIRITSRDDRAAGVGG